MGSFPLIGRDRDYWKLQNGSDLVALWPLKSPDPFSRWFNHAAMPFFHDVIGSKFKVRLTRLNRGHVSDFILQRPVSKELGDGIYMYNDQNLRMIARLASTVVASILPLCSVIILYFIRSNGVRLIIIVVLSAFFSLALALMTNARKIEIFAATSA
jgi:hypothetical protein